MKTFLKCLAIVCCLWGAIIQVYSQGHLVPNGVETNTFPGEINVWNPNGSQATTFILTPSGKQQPTFYINVFAFSEPVTIGVRVFLVSANAAISLQPILSQSFTELLYPNQYVFAEGEPFYVGLYTGYNFAPPYPPQPPYTYLDPVFGWAELVNNQGVIQLLDSALEYQGGGIYAGTRTIIPVPEPSALALGALGAILVGFRRWQK